MNLSRRSLLLAAPACLLGAKPASLRVACSTAPFSVDPNHFETFLATLSTVKQLGFEGFETSFANVRGEFSNAGPALDRIHKTGLRFSGITVALKTYDPHTFIPSQVLLEQVADGGKSLGAERLVVSGDSVVHPLAVRAKADALETAAKYCKDAGLICAYRTRDFDFRDAAAQLNALAAATKDHVHFVLDAAEGVPDFLAKYPRRVDGIHLMIGQPESAWEPLKKAIQTAQWKGWLVVEGEKGAEVAPAREAVRRIFGV